MKFKRIAISVVGVLILIAAASVFAQMNRPYRNGTVWDIGFIRMKPGMESAYMNYLSGSWKKEQEALKKEGLIISYKIISVEGHTPGEFNLMLMTEYKDLASMEAGEQKADALMQTVIGSDDKQMQGYKERSEIREIIGNRLGREIVLEPRKTQSE
ncbi:MAG TPA: hypothetical protein VLE19_10135 [Pyrinomonadaceae bacterium]|nr:hypothetical protein [Pyrinomonadaceae bacterium]